MTEKEKMLAGELYNPNDNELLSARQTAHILCQKYNATDETQAEERAAILQKLIPAAPSAYLQGPIFFDYGLFTEIGKNFYANFNFTVLDVCPVKIGDNVFVGPNVSVLTPKHPLLPQERNQFIDENGNLTNREYGAPVTIGDDCWIAGNVTILAGAEIGSGCVIGAGSVVTGKIPQGYLAYGNPCRPIRKITEADSMKFKK